jgi:Zinc finger, C2H2 type
MIHLESGNCPCGTNDEELRKLAARCYQHNHYIVRGMEHYVQNHQHPDAGPEHFNYYFQRYECPECDRAFNLLGGLKQHLSSPIHDEYAFKCPETNCDKRFRCISGLLQHLESSECREVAYGAEAIGKMLHYIATNL